VRAPYPGSEDSFLSGLLSAAPRDDGDPWDEALTVALGSACANAEMEGTVVFDPARACDLAARARHRVGPT
jgi:hypothetical protein